MTLEDLGYNDKLEKLRYDNNLKEFEIGRVISEHKERSEERFSRNAETDLFPLYTVYCRDSLLFPDST